MVQFGNRKAKFNSPHIAIHGKESHGPKRFSPRPSDPERILRNLHLRRIGRGRPSVAEERGLKYGGVGGVFGYVLWRVGKLPLLLEESQSGGIILE